jgi:hypothetical protein
MLGKRHLTRVGLMLLAPVVFASCVSGGANQLVEPRFVPPVGTGVVSSSAARLAFSGTGATYAQTFNVTYSGFGTLTIAPGTCAGPPAIVTFDHTSVTPPASVTVTPQRTGTCTFTVSDAQGSAVSIGVTVNSAGVVVSGRSR